MGYAYYELPDGREAGYAVEDVCNFPGCTEEIDRGLGYLCGEWPKGLAPQYDQGLFGCGDYFCEIHLDTRTHNCSRPICGLYSEDGSLYCFLTKDHEGEHFDWQQYKTFTEVEPEFLYFDADEENS